MTRIFVFTNHKDGADALSQRELEVLRLLADGLDSSEIAGRLVIAVDTAQAYQEHLQQARCSQPLGSHQTRGSIPFALNTPPGV